MKKQLAALLVVGVVALPSCAKKSPTDFRESASTEAVQQAIPGEVAREILEQTGWTLEENLETSESLNPELMKRGPQLDTVNNLLKCKRTQLAGNIVHYEFQIFVGPSAYDVIGLHRVVKEKRFCHPIKTNKTFFYQHGDAKDFAGMTLPGTLSPNTADDFGIAVFLAQNDVDVWGIDQAWTLVPAEAEDHSFMADWGLQKQVDDLSLAMSIARFTRLFTGSGFAPMILSGYSSGVITGYALLNQETQMPQALRNVKGFIPVDVPLKTDDDNVRQVFLDEYARVKAQIDTGEYADFMAFPLVAELARADPDGDSPIVPGFTNMQTALFFGAGPLYGVIHYHFLAGIWEDAFPTNFEYVTMDQWLDFMAAGTAWEAAQFIADYCRVIADIEDVPFDDYLAQITVPIFVVGAAGGMGEYAKYGSGLIGSSDLTHHIVQLKPAEEVLLDFAHIDIFLANNAQSQVWQPILDWIISHTQGWAS